MYYVYVMKSLKDNELYTGFTDNLERRIKEHNNREEVSTKSRVPFKLIYFEGCLNKKDAIAREKQLKTGRGKKYLRDRLRNHRESLE
ncbi:MAG: GIY-YIG nuclease family protein [Candidatus Omnitrophica bacterium]|nr:GIY-YIG nuclease family protein [Candidatus Omnitrophota bacterium]MBU4590110.1 GIY-YIG nuclease family protein [Candidatus Omnitrophota bacterium]